MAAREYRFTVETADGEELLAYEGRIQGVGRVRAVSNGTAVQIILAPDDEETDNTVLASGVDPGGDVDLVLVRDTVNGKGKPVTKKVRREVPTEPAITTEP
jgi:hypothetical protein